MPSDRELARRGGVTKIRTKVVNGRKLRIYVVRKPGPRGGRSVAVVDEGSK